MKNFYRSLLAVRTNHSCRGVSNDGVRRSPPSHDSLRIAREMILPAFVRVGLSPCSIRETRNACISLVMVVIASLSKVLGDWQIQIDSWYRTAINAYLIPYLSWLVERAMTGVIKTFTSRIWQ